MEENQYRQAYHSLNPHPCAFEKAVLSGRCACVQSYRIYIAERETVACLARQTACRELLIQLHNNARFALKISHSTGPLPHTKEMKVQCGGLLGLQAILYPELAQLKQVENIDALVTQASITFEQFDRLPYQELVRFITHYQVRHAQ